MEIGEIASHYRVLSKLGEGGMGVVYAAEDTRLNRRVALKFLPERTGRFAREALAVASLSHPNICTIYDVGEYEGRPFLALELLEGETLKERIARRPLTSGEVIELGLQVLEGLAAAHAKGVLHRDIKPANIFVTAGGQAKILDFGLAKVASLQQRAGRPEAAATETAVLLTSPGTAIGTAAYMSPEQALGEELDARSDLFSFGLVFYEMAAGRRAFGGTTAAAVFDGILHQTPAFPTRLNPDLPPELDRIIGKAIEKSRNLRYQTALEMRADLEKLVPLSSSRRLRTAAPPSARRRHYRALWAAAGALAVLAAAFALRPAAPAPSVLGTEQLTSDGQRKSFAPDAPGQRLLTDGFRIYFTEGSPRSFMLQQVSTEGGEPAPLPLSFELYGLCGMSSRRPELLLSGAPANSRVPELWTLPVPGGQPRRLGDISATEAVWSPDGESLLYVAGHDLYRAAADGSGSRKLATLAAAPFWPRWSPDGSTIRFSTMDSHLLQRAIWEVRPDGSGLHQMFRDWSAEEGECCGNWTPDGRWFVFEALRGGQQSLWAVREKVAFWQKANRLPQRLTVTEMSMRAPEPSRDGKKIFFIGIMPRDEIVRWDARQHAFVPFLSGLSAEGLRFSGDGRSVAYTSFPDSTLWRARADGTARTQLTFPPMIAGLPRWSPDGKRIAFQGQMPGKEATIYILPADGGTPEAAFPDGRPAMDAGWSADGNSLVFGMAAERGRISTEDRIGILDLGTRKVSWLAGSKFLFSPRWSPDGRYIAALTGDFNRVVLYDTTSRSWSDLASVTASYPEWSQDGGAIYCVGFLDHSLPFYRVRLADRKVEKVTEFSGYGHLAWGRWGPWTGLGPDDAPLAARDISVEEVFALDWDPR